jgi:hypothetical protein
MPDEVTHLINKETLIPIGLVCTIMGASVTFGVMYNKVDQLGGIVDKQTEVISSLREQSARQEATISQVLTTLSDIKSDVNAIRDAQSKKYGGT